jgi:ribonuclease P protein component
VPAAPRPRPRDLRLTRGAEIRELLKTGRRLSAPPLRVVYRPTDRGHARLAVQVSRRTARTAVRRNRIRRRTREAFRRLLSDSGMAVDVMVLAGAEVERLPWNELLARGRGVLMQIEQAERIERGEREPSPPHPA